MPAKNEKQTLVSTSTPKTTLTDNIIVGHDQNKFSILGYDKDNRVTPIFSIKALPNGQWSISGRFTDFFYYFKNVTKFPNFQEKFIQFFEEEAKSFDNFCDIHCLMAHEYALVNNNNDNLTRDYITLIQPIRKPLLKLINRDKDLIIFLTGIQHPTAKKQAILDELISSDHDLLSAAIHDISRLAYLIEHTAPPTQTVFNQLFSIVSMDLYTWIEHSEKPLVFDCFMKVLSKPVITDLQSKQVWNILRYQVDGIIENIGQLTELLKVNFLDEIMCTDLFSNNLISKVLEWIIEEKPEPVFLLLDKLKKKFKTGESLELFINTIWWRFIFAFSRNPTIKKLDGLFKLQSHLETDLNEFKDKLLAGSLLDGNPATQGALLIVIMSYKKIPIEQRLEFYQNAKQRIKESIQKNEQPLQQTMGEVITKTIGNTINRAKDFIPFYLPSTSITDTQALARLELKTKKEFGKLITENDILIDLLKIIQDPTERLFIIQSAQTNENILNNYNNFRCILNANVLTDTEIKVIWSDLKNIVYKLITDNKVEAFAILHNTEFTPALHLDVFNYVIEDCRINKIITDLESFIYIYRCINLTPKERNLLVEKFQHCFDSWVNNINITVAYLQPGTCEPPQIKEIWEKLIKSLIKKLQTTKRMSDLLTILDCTTIPAAQQKMILNNKEIIQSCIKNSLNLTELFLQKNMTPTLQGIVLNHLSNELLTSLFSNQVNFKQFILCDKVDVNCNPILRRLSKKNADTLTLCYKAFASSTDKNNIPNLESIDEYINYFRQLRAEYRIKLLNQDPENDSGCMFFNRSMVPSLNEKIAAIDQILDFLLERITTPSATNQSAINKKKSLGRIGQAFEQWCNQNLTDGEENDDNSQIVSPRS